MAETQTSVHFQDLQAQSAKISEPAFKVTVVDGGSKEEAMILAKQIKTFTKQIEERRKTLTAPLVAQKKEIDDFAKKISTELLNAEAHLKSELIKWEQKLEAERRAAFLELEREKRERERLLEEQKQNALLEKTGLELFGATPQQAAIVEEKLENLSAEHQENQIFDKLAAKNIEENRVSGTRKHWTFNVTNEKLVPREYLMIDPRLIRAAVQAGVRQIPGVEIYEETRIAIKT